MTLLRADLIRKIPQVVGRDTFNAYAQRWLDGHFCGNGTRLYIQRVIDAMDPYIGAVRVSDIRATDLAAAYRGLEKGTKQPPSQKRPRQGLATSTVARYASWVNTIFLAAPSTSSPQALGRVPPGPWSPRSSKTSSKPPDTWPPTHPGAPLDPPLLLALDEIGNLSPLPSLPVLMAEGGGTGITTMPILQSLSQARDRWGDHAANAIWDASIAKIILGGSSSARDLQELTALIGERDETTDTISIGDHGSRSLQRSTRQVPVMPPEVIRTLLFGTASVLLRSAPPIVTHMRPWSTNHRSASAETQC